MGGLSNIILTLFCGPSNLLDALQNSPGSMWWPEPADCSVNCLDPIKKKKTTKMLLLMFIEPWGAAECGLLYQIFSSSLRIAGSVFKHWYLLSGEKIGMKISFPLTGIYMLIIYMFHNILGILLGFEFQHFSRMIENKAQLLHLLKFYQIKLHCIEKNVLYHLMD